MPTSWRKEWVENNSSLHHTVMIKFISESNNLSKPTCIKKFTFSSWKNVSKNCLDPQPFLWRKVYFEVWRRDLLCRWVARMSLRVKIRPWPGRPKHFSLWRKVYFEVWRRDLPCRWVARMSPRVKIRPGPGRPKHFSFIKVNIWFLTKLRRFEQSLTHIAVVRIGSSSNWIGLNLI